MSEFSSLLCLLCKETGIGGKRSKIGEGVKENILILEKIFSRWQLDNIWSLYNSNGPFSYCCLGCQLILDSIKETFDKLKRLEMDLYKLKAQVIPMLDRDVKEDTKELILLRSKSTPVIQNGNKVGDTKLLVTNANVDKDEKDKETGNVSDSHKSDKSEESNSGEEFDDEPEIKSKRKRGKGKTIKKQPPTRIKFSFEKGKKIKRKKNADESSEDDYRPDETEEIDDDEDDSDEIEEETNHRYSRRQRKPTTKFLDFETKIKSPPAKTSPVKTVKISSAVKEKPLVSPVKVEIKQEPAPFECTWTNCDLSFVDTEELTRHYQGHLNKMFKCKHCKKDFTKSNDLKRHISKYHTVY